MSTKSLWVFGYGSLLWAPGFAFTDLLPGKVRGYSRKFWQGNTTHRGTPEQAEVWGVAYEVKDSDAIPYLNEREVKLGGYRTAFSWFHPEEGEPFLVLLYMATPDSSNWLGSASDYEIAQDILHSSGPSGHNVEYLLRLAEFVRNQAPDVEDPHLFGLESIVRMEIRERGLPLETLMGPAKPLPSPVAPEDLENDAFPPIKFVSTIKMKKLRCLSI
ncbi:putative glutathione-specific gamma-glutamylcyclotransferase 2 isoform X2 [Cimex lectularius]|uniref:glutathione-specific gamma-glutamylcyclotransferase n=1 Tax=Cimex lectularius TaxID=79782 RepID=A0A8I6RZV6_CIMLE|nr:putative glutathione-specific gamma-glutamylcyclotransferase 2 isoform X2 [Cimex lectularius]